MRFSKYFYIVASPVPRSGRNAMQALILRPWKGLQNDYLRNHHSGLLHHADNDHRASFCNRNISYLL